MTLEAFIDILHKVPDKDILIRDNISTAYVSDFRIKNNYLILILTINKSKFYSVRSLVRQLLPLEDIKNVCVSYGLHYYDVTGLSITKDKVILDSYAFRMVI